MIAENIDGVEFVCANTDSQALGRSNARVVLQLGDEITKGFGAVLIPASVVKRLKRRAIAFVKFSKEQTWFS